MKKISICGLNCGDCPAFIAYKNNNDQLRRKTAQKWIKLYNAPGIKPQDINCRGCLSLIKPLYSHCLKCAIRKCGIERKLNNCGQCKDYNNCQKIANFHQQVPEGKTVCDNLKKNYEKK